MVQCVLRFDNCTLGVYGGVGLGDATHWLFQMHSLAAVWGCATVLPSPHCMLATFHNRDLEVPETWTWDRYYDVAASWVGVLPASEAPPASLVTSNLLTIDSMRAVERKGTVVDMRVIRSDMGVIKELKAAGPRHDLAPAPLREWAAPSPWHWNVKLDPAKWGLKLSNAALQSVDEAQRLLLDSAFVGIHVRRGDKIGIVGLAWANQTSVGAVTRIAQSLQKQAALSRRGPANMVFVATDETDNGYLTALRTELQQTFKRVVFESEVVRCCMIDAEHARDNFFAFLVSMTLLLRASRFLDLHPLMAYQLEALRRSPR